MELDDGFCGYTLVFELIPVGGDRLTEYTLKFEFQPVG